MTVKKNHIAFAGNSKLMLAGLLLSGLCLAGCMEEYWPELGERYDKVLVVDGSITNLPGPYMVRLSLSTGLENPTFETLTGYTVIISDDAGNSEELHSAIPGIYQTSPGGIQGVPGRSYTITITSPNGKIYSSSPEKLEEPVEVDTIRAEYETQENLDYDHLLEGYRFYITTAPADRDTVFFLWRLKGTYQYNANHYIKYIFDGELRPFTQFDSLRTCWATYQIPEIFTQNTAHVSTPFLANYPLHFVNTEDKKLSVRYSLLAEQYVISARAHEYWDNLREQSAELGSLYTVQPFQVRGNIENINDPDELVLGYFMAASVTDYRIFVDRPWYARFHYLTECFMIKGDISYKLWSMIAHWPVYLTATYTEYGQNPALPVSQECVDCTKSGGTIIKPEFWIDINYE